MAKEILFYTSMNSYSISDFINNLEASKGDDVVVRMNCPGGSVYDGYGAIAKYQEFQNGKKIKVDGRADSMAAYMVAMTPPDQVECLDVSTFTFHRAALPSWVESNSQYFTEEVKASLTGVNTTLRGFIEGRVTADQWKKVTGVSLDDMFSLSARIDVPLTAEKMKKLGMVGTVNKITPKKLAEIKAYSADLAAELLPHVEAETTTTETPKIKIMTIQDVKANSEVFNALKAEILADEKDRIAAFAEFKDIDAKSVLEAIISGDAYKASFGAKMQVKAMSATGVANMTAASAQAVATPEAGNEKTKEAQAEDAFKKDLEAELKRNLAIA